METTPIQAGRRTTRVEAASQTEVAPLWRALPYYGAQAVIVLVILFVSLHLLQKDLTIPFTPQGDGLHFIAIAKALAEDGWWWHISRLSAPFTLPMVAFPVGGNVDFAAMKFLTLFTSS